MIYLPNYMVAQRNIKHFKEKRVAAFCFHDRRKGKIFPAVMSCQQRRNGDRFPYFEF